MRRLVVAAAVAVAVAPPAQAASVGVTHATTKIRPSTPIPAGTAASLQAARNEFEAFQVAIAGPATTVRATATALTGPAGSIAAPRLFREDLITTTSGSDPLAEVGAWPDALVPDVDEVQGEARRAFPFDVASGQTRAIWAEVFVPASAVAGTYTGTVTLTYDGGSATIPVSLEVWPFTLPSTSSLRSAYAIGYGAIPTQHHVAGGSTDHAVLTERYVRLALDHRVTISHIDDGNVSTSHFDAYYGPLMSGSAPTRLSGAKLTASQYLWNDYATWVAFFKQKGWFDRLFQYTCDEPPNSACGSDGWNKIPQIAAAAKAVDPNFRTLVTTTVSDASAHGLLDVIDLLVPVVNWMHDKDGMEFAGDQRPSYDPFLSMSALKEVWLYQSCMSHDCGGSSTYGTGWPSLMIDASAVRNRAMEWISFLHRATGELYFTTTEAYSGDPWTSQWAYTGNGDGTLFYPGTTARIGGTSDVPLASLRLKMIREGMEDYEYLAMLAGLGDRSSAEAIASSVFPNPYSTEQDPAALYQARSQIAQRIIALQGGTTPPPVDPPPTPTPTTPEHTAPATGTAVLDGAATEYGDDPILLSCAQAGCDGSAQVHVAYDPVYLHVQFAVDDPSIFVNAAGTDGENWNGDSVEVFIDASDDKTSALDSDDYHVVVSTAGTITDERGSAGAWDRSWSSGTTAKVVKSATGYTIELDIPWGNLGLAACGGEVIGFDVAVNDVDASGGAVFPYDWAQLSRFAQPSRWGNLTLGPRLAASTIDIARAPSAPVVDGQLGEWTWVPAIHLDAAAAAAGSDNGLDVKLMWDAKNLYAAYAVRDATLVAKGSRDADVWSGDAVQLFLDTLGDRTASLKGDDYTIAIGSSGIVSDRRGKNGAWDKSWASGVSSKVVRTADGYAVELAVPWSRLGVTARAGLVLGLDVAGSDNDGGTARQFDWTGSTPYTSPSLWRSAVLSSGPACQ